MKKLFVFLLLFFLFATLNALEDENESGFGIDLGTIGIGINSDTGLSKGFFYGHLLNFMYSSRLGINFFISPLFLSYNYIEAPFSCTFVNISVSYNTLNRVSNFFVLGPFISMSAIDYNNPKYFEFSAGLNFSLRSWESWFYADFLMVELGYKLNNAGKRYFYAQIGVNVIAGLAIIAAGNVSGAPKEVKDQMKDPERPYHP